MFPGSRRHQSSRCLADRGRLRESMVILVHRPSLSVCHFGDHSLRFNLWRSRRKRSRRRAVRRRTHWNGKDEVGGVVVVIHRCCSASRSRFPPVLSLRFLLVLPSPTSYTHCIQTHTFSDFKFMHISSPKATQNAITPPAIKSGSSSPSNSDELRSSLSLISLICVAFRSSVPSYSPITR